MSVLTAVLTHLGPDAVARQLAHLRAVEPASAYVVLHGGRQEDFDRLDPADAVFVEDPSLRGPVADQSYTGALRLLWEARVRPDPDVELVHLIEYDHLVLAPFADALARLARETGAGLLAKGAGPRDDTNWAHMLRYRGDPEVDRFFRRISVRDEPGRRLGCLGTGLVFRRDALEAFAAASADAPHAYLELMIPSTVHHLGFDVVDVDAVSDLYAAVRWHPEYAGGWRAEYAPAEVAALQRRGAVFVHPFKRLDLLAGPAAA